MSSPVQTSEKAPTWITEHLEGLDWIAKEREREALELRFPGLKSAFEGILECLPSRYRADNSEFPVAAGVASKDANGKFWLVEISGNLTNRHGDSTGHAEIEVLKKAQSSMGSKHLGESLLLTTLEPCVMCCGGAVNTAVSAVIYGAEHDDIDGKHALVGGEYKPWRTSPEGFDAETYLTASGIEVVSGFMRDEVLKATERFPGNWNEYYRDPDA